MARQKEPNKGFDLAAAFDLREIDAATSADMTIVAGGRRTNWTWTFAGPGHPKSVEQTNRLTREHLKRNRDVQRSLANGYQWQPPRDTPEDLLERNVNFVLERLLGWSDVTFNGEPFPFSIENARTILSDPNKGALLLQALEFLGDKSSFVGQER